MAEAELDHEPTGLCWCGKYHSKIVEIHLPAPDWAPNTEDLYDEDTREDVLK